MVWSLKRVMVAMMSCCVMLLAYTTDTFAYSIYSEGNISSTYTTIFEDIVQGLSSSDDYVFWRSGQYEYTMITGNLELYGSTFSSPDLVTEYSITTGTGYNSYYTYTVTEDISAFTLNSENYLVYSNLGNYPILIERGALYEYSTLATLIIIGCCLLLRPMFDFVLRYRNGN